MISTVLVVALFIIGVFVYVVGIGVKPSYTDEYGKKVDAPNLPRGIKTVGVLLALSSIVIAFFMSFTVIQGYEIGVPVSFGKVGSQMKAGAHIVAPWTSVETYPTRPLKIPNMETDVRTQQGGAFHLTLSARWHTDNGTELYYQTRTGDEDKITDTVVDPSLSTAARNVYTTIDNQTAFGNAKSLEGQLQIELQSMVAKYGIKIDDVYMYGSQPDQHTADTINQLTAQQQQTKIASAQLDTEKAKQAVIEQQAINQQLSATKLPANLTPTQTALYCANLWWQAQQLAIPKGVQLWTSPCGGGITPTILKNAQ